MTATLIVKTLASYGFIGLILFGAAGTLDWPSAWVFLVQMTAFSIAVGLWLARRDPALMTERLGPLAQPGQPAADRIVLAAILVVMFGSFALMGLDAVRLRWSAAPFWVKGVGELLLALSLWISVQTLVQNTFAAPVVKLQEGRRQTVVTSGPYRHVRHPLYSGAVLFVVGTSLFLGSWWGLAAAFALAVVFAFRIRIEEETLRAGLEGYDAYARRVRYRLVPLIW